MKKKRRPNLLFVVDPWDTLDHERDTTLRLIEEALLAGARCAVAENRWIGLDHGVPYAETTEVLEIKRPRRSRLYHEPTKASQKPNLSR